MTTEQKQWLNDKIEKLVKNPNEAQFGILKGRCDLEIIVRVADEDKALFTPEKLEELKKEIAEKTGVFSPVVYLEGKEPEWLARGEYIY